MRRIDAYRVRNRDNLGDPQFWNVRFDELDNRLHKHDQDLAEINAVAERVEGAALDRINTVVTPLVEETRERFSSVTAMFYATSLSEVGVSAGVKIFNIEADQRATFAPLAFLFIHPIGSRANGIVVSVESFSRTSGNLVVNVEQVIGAGVFSAWAIEPVASTADLEALRDAVEGLRDHAVAAAVVSEASRDAALAARGDAEAARDGAVSAHNTIFSIYRGVSSTPPEGGAAGHFYVNTGVDPPALTFHTGAGWHVNEPLPAHLSEEALDERYLNASNLATGTVPNARLPARLRELGEAVTDWNNATRTGFYVGSDAANAPVAGWFIGVVESQNAGGWLTQTVNQFTAASASDTKAYRRHSQGAGNWTAWYRLRMSETELEAWGDARFSKSRIDRWGAGVVSITGAGTIDATHAGKLLIFGGASNYTVGLAAAATLGDGWTCYLKATTSIVVTLDPNGSETIDGATTISLARGQECLLVCDGASFHTVGLTRRAHLVRAAFTGASEAVFTFPPGFDDFVIETWLTTDTTGQTIRCRLSTDGGATFVSSTGAYERSFLTKTNNTTLAVGATSDTSGILAEGVSANRPAIVTATVRSPRSASEWTKINAVAAGERHTAAGPHAQNHVTERAAAEAHDAIRIYAGSGNISGWAAIVGVKY